MCGADLPPLFAKYCKIVLNAGRSRRIVDPMSAMAVRAPRRRAVASLVDWRTGAGDESSTSIIKVLRVLKIVMGAGASFGELCVLGLSTVSLVDATCVVQSDFFFIHRDRFLNAFSNLPEVLAEMAAREDVYRRRPVRVPKASLGST